jgi:tetratricopeptide (TPR) repeat protein
MTFINITISYSQDNKDAENLKSILNTANQRLENNPNDAFYLSVRANVYYNLGELGKALNDLNKAVLLDKDNWENYYNKGIILHELGKNDSSIVAYNQAISLNNKNYKIYAACGLAQYELGKYIIAIDNYSKSISHVTQP